MMSPRKSLGVMRPLGGGDEIPLKKEELIIGRRPKCDIQLDFENISGKHCLLKFVRGTWHVRDLGSTNGTTVNGQRISSEHGLLCDDELGIAGHFFALDYDAAAPTSVMDANMILEEEMTDSPRQHSLMELAGLETYDSPSRRGPARQASQPQRSSERMARHSADDARSMAQDHRPPEVEADTVDDNPIVASDDEFFEMIKGDVKDDGPPKRKA